ATCADARRPPYGAQAAYDGPSHGVETATGVRTRRPPVRPRPDRSVRTPHNDTAVRGRCGRHTPGWDRRVPPPGDGTPRRPGHLRGTWRALRTRAGAAVTPRRRGRTCSRARAR